MVVNKKEILEKFGVILRETREAKRLKADDIYLMTDLARSTISRIEKGTKSIDLVTILKLCAALEIDANTIITEELIQMVLRQ